jgi:hypothetical protein
MKDVEGKYKVGTTVFAKVTPDEALIIRRYVAKIYYCKLADKSDDADLVYFERELMSLQEKKDQA